MTFTLEPACQFAQKLNHLIIKATFNPANEWFFYDGAYNGFNSLEQNMNNTWLHEHFVAVDENREIFAYFEGQWSRPMDIITGFRTINFDPNNGITFLHALYAYFDYLFVNRGCRVLNWTVALENIHALKQYEQFITNYCGHKVGTRHYAQKSYTGRISDINLYELTQEEYLEWKGRDYRSK